MYFQVQRHFRLAQLLLLLCTSIAGVDSCFPTIVSTIDLSLFLENSPPSGFGFVWRSIERFKFSIVVIIPLPPSVLDVRVDLRDFASDTCVVLSGDSRDNQHLFTYFFFEKERGDDAKHVSWRLCRKQGCFAVHRI